MASLDTKAFTKLNWYYQIAIVAGFCAALLGSVWYWYLAPIEAEIVAKEEQLAALQLEVAKSLLQKRTFERLKADSADLTRRLDELKNVLPLDRETPEILRSIRSEAAASSVGINRIALRPFIDHDVYREWPWDMEVVGTYHNITTFFDRLRKLSRIVNVANLKISSRASEGEQAFTASVGATYTATTFIYFEESLAAGTIPPKPDK